MEGAIAAAMPTTAPDDHCCLFAFALRGKQVQTCGHKKRPPIFSWSVARIVEAEGKDPSADDSYDHW
jgi:hypothetical protein